MKCKQINFSVDNISLLVSFGDKSSDRTLAYCSALLLHEKAKIMNDMNASESVAAHAGFSFPDLQVIFARLMLFSRRSCMMTRISYSHDGSHPTYGATYRMLLLLLLISSYDPYASSSFTSVDKPQVNPQKV